MTVGPVPPDTAVTASRKNDPRSNVASTVGPAVNAPTAMVTTAAVFVYSAAISRMARCSVNVAAVGIDGQLTVSAIVNWLSPCGAWMHTGCENVLVVNVSEVSPISIRHAPGSAVADWLVPV